MTCMLTRLSFPYEGMSEGVVSDFLREQGIPEKYCEVFEGKLVAFLTSIFCVSFLCTSMYVHQCILQITGVLYCRAVGCE